MKRALLNKFTKLLLTFILVLSLTLGCSRSTNLKQPANKPELLSHSREAKSLPKAVFSFVVFGDNRPDEYQDSQPEAFKKIVVQINQERPALVFNTGDMVAGDTSNYSYYKKEYQDFLKVIRTLKAPFYGAVGNHDAEGLVGQKLYQKSISPKLYRSLDYKNSHFIILNTEVIGEEGVIGPKQLSWLKNDLRAHQNSGHIFVFMHRPLYSVMNPNSRWGQHAAFVSIQNRDTLRELMEKYKVDVVFAGHEHFFNQQARNNVTYIITGCAGASPYTDARHGGFLHYVAVKVKGEKISLEVVKRGGQRLNPDSIPTPHF